MLLRRFIPIFIRELSLSYFIAFHSRQIFTFQLCLSLRSFIFQLICLHTLISAIFHVCYTPNYYPLNDSNKWKERRTALSWAITQCVMVIRYRHSGTSSRSNLQESRIQRIPTTRCVTAQKSTVLVHFAAEARNHGSERPSCCLTTSVSDRTEWFWQDILLCCVLSCKYVLLCLREISAIYFSCFIVFARYLLLCNMKWNWYTGQRVKQLLLLYHRNLCSSSFTNTSNYGACVKGGIFTHGYVDAVKSLCVPLLVCLLFASRLKESIFSVYCQRW